MGISIALSQIVPSVALSPQEVGKIAKQIVVRIDGGASQGSGVIIRHEGNTYHVLTAKHVIFKEKNSYTIITPDGDRYRVNYPTIQKLPGVDLAIVQFVSTKNYPIAQLGDAKTLTEGATVHVAGFPKGSYQFSSGSISSLRTGEQVQEGYAVGYVNNTAAGMSGGPVLDEDGRLIAIHGRANGEEIVDQSSGQVFRITDGFNWGIPINTFLELAPQPNPNLRSVITHSPVVTTPSRLPVMEKRGIFIKSPRLLGAATTFNRAYTPGGTYYFNVTIPENAGASLQEITLTQVQGEDIDYRFEETEAFEGTHRHRGADLKPIKVANNLETRSISVTFSAPVPPGKTVTIGLSPTRNPMDGVYLFKVTVFPQGDNPQGLDLGVGRLHFYNR
jgi:hypothetical protein